MSTSASPLVAIIFDKLRSRGTDTSAAAIASGAGKKALSSRLIVKALERRGLLLLCKPSRAATARRRRGLPVGGKQLSIRALDSPALLSSVLQLCQRRPH
jgi:hypothetical protein